MAQPVVHVEIIGRDPARLRAYYTELFGWDFATGGPVSAAVSRGRELRLHRGDQQRDRRPGRGGGGSGYQPHALFYVGVADVDAALRKAEELGGIRRMGPERSPGTELVVGHFTDPEGNLIGVAGGA